MTRRCRPEPLDYISWPSSPSFCLIHSSFSADINKQTKQTHSTLLISNSINLSHLDLPFPTCALLSPNIDAIPANQGTGLLQLQLLKDLPVAEAAAAAMAPPLQEAVAKDLPKATPTELRAMPAPQTGGMSKTTT